MFNKLLLGFVCLLSSTAIYANESSLHYSIVSSVYYLFFPLLILNIVLLAIFIGWDRRQKKLIERNRDLHSQVAVLNEELDIKKRMLEQMSTTDRLTRLNNRHFVESAYEDILSESQDLNQEFSILLFDIDHFKSVNDTYGHNAGDLVLESFGAIIKGYKREGDVTARWGGEEFLIVCPNTSNDEAYELAEKLRKAIETHKFPEVGRCTTSIGVATNTGNESQTDLILRADKALYKAKESGRNIVIRADIE